MIPAANIIAWRRRAPWPDDIQVEQDLILSRMMIEIANHDLLGAELAFRGGTCLHKLHLSVPARYSEDLDYVRRTRSGVGPYLDALDEIAGTIGVTKAGTETGRSIVNAKFDAEPTFGLGRIRVKVEINVAETEPLLPRAAIPYEIDSPWWHGAGEIASFAPEELLGTKLRALYQRSKGRDLFDLWLALTELDLDDDQIVACFKHYIAEDEFTFPQLARNLEAKLESREFRDDLTELVVTAPESYDPAVAANLVMARLGAVLHNAPPAAEIENGAWRLRS